jgi:hypothetical protein
MSGRRQAPDRSNRQAHRTMNEQEFIAVISRNIHLIEPGSHHMCKPDDGE